MKSLQQPPTTTRKETRADRGLALYRDHHDEIEHIGHGVYRVPGCSGGVYEVELAVFGGTETCSCPDRAPTCKHVYAATVYRSKSRVEARRAQAERTRARASRGNLAPLADALATL